MLMYIIYLLLGCFPPSSSVLRFPSKSSNLQLPKFLLHSCNLIYILILLSPPQCCLSLQSFPGSSSLSFSPKHGHEHFLRCFNMLLPSDPSLILVTISGFTYNLFQSFMFHQLELLHRF